VPGSVVGMMDVQRFGAAPFPIMDRKGRAAYAEWGRREMPGDEGSEIIGPSIRGPLMYGGPASLLYGTNRGRACHHDKGKVVVRDVGQPPN
jgi:hypothetical protein